MKPGVVPFRLVNCLPHEHRRRDHRCGMIGINFVRHADGATVLLSMGVDWSWRIYLRGPERRGQLSDKSNRGAGGMALAT